MIRYYRGAEQPALSLWLLDDDGTLINFSSGYTFSLKLGAVGSAALLTKTTGITGAAGSGQEPDGVPNVEVDWSSGDLDLAVGSYEWFLTATNSGGPRMFRGVIQILGVIS